MNNCKLMRSMSTFRKRYGHWATTTHHLLNTHYDVLKIGVNSSSKEIRTAFIRLSKQFHPDACDNQNDADKFIKICEAYKTLSKPNARRLYDQKLKAKRDFLAPIDLGYWQPNIRRNWEKYQAEMRKKQIGSEILMSAALTSPYVRSAALSEEKPVEKLVPLEPTTLTQTEDTQKATPTPLEEKMLSFWSEAQDMRKHWNFWATLYTGGFSLIALIVFASCIKEWKKARQSISFRQRSRS